MQQRLGIGENSRGREVLSLVRVSPLQKVFKVKIMQLPAAMLVPLGALVMI